MQNVTDFTTQRVEPSGSASAGSAFNTPALGADELCVQLQQVVGRPVSLVQVAVDQRADDSFVTRATVRVGDAAGHTSSNHEGIGVAVDVALSTTRAVFDAMQRVDPVAVAFWDLYHRGHARAALRQAGDGGSISIGPAEEVDRLGRLCQTVGQESSVEAKTRTGTYRVLTNDTFQIALSVLDQPVTAAAVDAYFPSRAAAVQRSTR